MLIKQHDVALDKFCHLYVSMGSTVLSRDLDVAHTEPQLTLDLPCVDAECL